MRRWICPRCGSGAHAPERPRKNDVRRYCLKCSGDTGFLVERVAPAVERRRARSAALRGERAKTKREREREAKRRAFLVSLPDALDQPRELDLQAEFNRALRDCGGSASLVKRARLTLRRSKKKDYSTGRAFDSYPPEVVLTVSLTDSAERVLELVYHEAAHLVLYAEGRPVAHHGPRFRKRLADGLRNRWPFVDYGPINEGRVYDSDRFVAKQLCQHVQDGGEL